MIKTSAGARTRSYSLIPWFFPGGLLLVLGVNTVLLILALNSWPGRVSTNAYEEGRQYDRLLAREAAIEALGWQVSARLVPGEPSLLEVRYVDREGRALTGLAPTAVLTRPVGDPVRLTHRLVESRPGFYEAKVVLQHRGIWQLHIEAGDASNRHEADTRLMAP
jgi:nitrogen fixation protein FixH